MVHFKFKLRTTEEGISDKIDALMMRERTQEGLFGDLYSEGIHFKKNGNKIRGFYIEENEWDTVKGKPIHSCFCGTIKKQENGDTYFIGWIYPEIVSFLLFILIPILIFFQIQELFGKILFSLVFCIILYQFIKLEDALYKELKRVFE